jgi:RND superfamily putative drug exporter
VWKTGSVITGAGVIMSIAFAGLMMSSTAVLLEFGAMLMSAVLFDTFIVRTIFLPAVLHLLGEANWWPGRQPTPTKGDADQIDVDDQHEAQATDEAQHFRLW